MMNKIAKVIGWTLLIPILLLFIVLVMPFVMLFEVKEAIAFRRFKRKEVGRLYLICTKRHGWKNFLINNVVPILPEKVTTVWFERQRDSRETFEMRLTDYLHRSGTGGVARPCLVLVSRGGLRCISLNSDFQELKTNAKRSESVQKKCRELIEEQMKSLREEK